MGIENKLFSKEDCVWEACAKINGIFSRNLNTIYSNILKSVQGESPDVQASFAINQEKSQVSAMVNQQLNIMRNTFIDALCHVSKPEHIDERAYSDSQAVIMWQSVAVRIELPVLEYPKIESVYNYGADISEEKLIFEVLKKHLQEISQELKQCGIPEKQREKVRKKMSSIICVYDPNTAHWTPKKQMGKTARSMALPAVSEDILTERKENILRKLKCWVDSIGEMVLAEEPIL